MKWALVCSVLVSLIMLAMVFTNAFGVAGPWMVPKLQITRLQELELFGECVVICSPALVLWVWAQ